MIKSEPDLLAERIAIKSYREMIAYLGDQDPTTRNWFALILLKRTDSLSESRERRT